MGQIIEENQEPKPLYDYLLRNIDFFSLNKDENYSRYLEDLPKLQEINGAFIAYQNQRIVYVGHPKIRNGLELVTEKVSRLICDNPVLIVKVGETNAKYLSKQ